MSEKIYYTDAQIRITSSLVDVDGATYPIRNIAGVSVAEADDNQVGGCLLIPLLLTLLVAGLAMLSGIGSGFSELTVKFISGSIIIAAVLFGLLILHFKNTPYELNLETSSGRTRALTSKNKEYLEELKRHVATAISEYR